MEKLKLVASKRTILGRKVKALRKSGIVPANVYGKKVKSQAVQIGEKEFTAAFAKAGETGLVELTVDSEKRPVLIHNLQYHPVTQKAVHVDFYQVDLKEKVVAKVPIHITGEATAVKDKLGVLLHILSEVEVEALPADLPDKIEIEVGDLATVGKTIKVGELKVSDKIKILTDGNLEVVKIAPLVSKEAEALAKEQEAAAAAAEAATAPTEAVSTEAAKPQEVPPADKPVETSQPPKKE